MIWTLKYCYGKSYLNVCLEHDNKFVRAWAYIGKFELSVQYKEYKLETMVLLEAALQNEAASVRARIRNIMKKMS